MRVAMTEVYRDWINELKDRSGRARIQMRVDEWIGWHMAIQASIAISRMAFRN